MTDRDVTKDEWVSTSSYTVEETRWPLYSVSWNKMTGVIAVGCGDSHIRYKLFFLIRTSFRFFTVEGAGESATIAPDLVVEAHEGWFFLFRINQTF